MKRILRNAAAVVGDLKYRFIPHKRNGKRQFRHAFCVEYGIFQKIQQYLFNKERIHGNVHKFLRYLRDDLLIRMLFGKLHENRVNQFIQNRGCLHDFHFRTVDSCNRQKIFNHADEPFAVLLNFSQQLELLLLWQRVILGDQRGGGPVYGGEWCAQIMGNRPQQIAPHSLFFTFCPQLFLIPNAAVQRSGGNGNCLHNDGR